jgi:hypothetical protein
MKKRSAAWLNQRVEETLQEWIERCGKENVTASLEREFAEYGVSASFSNMASNESRAARPLTAAEFYKTWGGEFEQESSQILACVLAEAYANYRLRKSP